MSNRISHQRAPDDRWLIIFSVLLVLTRGRDLSRFANAVSAGNHKFSLPPSQAADGEDLVILACTVFD